MSDFPPALSPASSPAALAPTPGEASESARLALARPTPDTVVAGAAVVRSRRDQVTKNGQPYLQVELANATGAVEARIWSERLSEWAGLDAGCPVYVEGRIKEGWNGRAPELDVRVVRALPAGHAVALELNPICPVPQHILAARLDGLLGLLRPGARALFDAVVDYVGAQTWWSAPAAKSNHDANVGGLAHHSIKVASAAVALAWASDAADRIWLDAVILGGLLHDIGKVEEYVWQNCAIDVSRRIHLTSHVASGVMLVHAAVAKAGDALFAAGMTTADVEHLCHTILSHHGQAEWGSPVAPCTLEAAVVHHADNACARTASLAEDLATCAVDRDGWADPVGWRRKPIWVAHSTAVRGDRLVAAHVGTEAIVSGLRSLLGDSTGAGDDGAAPPTAPTGPAGGPTITMPPLAIAEAAALVHSVWADAANWHAARRSRREGLLAVAEAVARQLPACEQARLARYRPQDPAQGGVSGVRVAA